MWEQQKDMRHMQAFLREKTEEDCNEAFIGCQRDEKEKMYGRTTT